MRESSTALPHSSEVEVIMVFEGFPFIIGWELTLACNLRCGHCGSSAGLPRHHELTLEESLAICDQFSELFVQEVNFTGGEPLSRSDWWKIAVYLGELGIITKILTNGLLLGPSIIAQMKDAGIGGVGVSIDGLEETHDHIRGREGLFQHLVTGIKQVLDVDIPVTVITTVNALNINELPSLFTYLRSLGVSSWQVQPMFPLGRGQAASDLHLSPQVYMQLGAFVKEWGSVALETGFDLLPGDSFGYYTELDTRQPQWRGCSAGRSACGITSDGKIKGCLSMPDELIEGDLKQNDLWDIWFHSDSFKYSRNFSPEVLGPMCAECDRANECLGGCTTMSLGATGKLHNNPYCFYGIRGREDGGMAKEEAGCLS